jgi:tetratricopeptide (TPR) repeat protein
VTQGIKKEPATDLRGALVKALMKWPLMSGLADRRTLIKLTRAGVVNFPDVEERSETRPHVLEIVLACLNHPGALNALREALELMAPDHPETRRACELIDAATLRSVLDASEVNRVHEMLRRAMSSRGDGDWWCRPSAEFDVVVPSDATDLVEAFDLLAAEPTGADRVPPALKMINFVARQVDDPLATELIDWASGRLEIEESERLFHVPGGQARTQRLPRPVDVLGSDPDGNRATPPSPDIVTVSIDLVDSNTSDVSANTVETRDGRSDIAQPEPDPEPDSADEPKPVDGDASSKNGDEMPPVATTNKAPTKLPRVWGDVPPRNPNFTGRGELLDRLHEELQRVSQTAVLPQALHGMGGVGKSQIAIEYVHRYSDRYDLVWWIPAQLDSQIKASLTHLAQRLELDVTGEANSAVPAVREALSTGEVEHSNWLLIFDNAESPEQVQQYFPTGGAGKILVTSRDLDWSRVTRTIEVDVFARPESIRYLTAQDPDLPEADADRLAEALGDLPLAIEQVAAWRSATGMPVEEYLELLQEKTLELLDAVSSPHYRRPVAAAWKVSMDKLRSDNEAAFQLLQLCSFFAPEPISRELLAGAPVTPITELLNQTLSDRFRLSRAFLDIQRSALARIDPKQQTLQIHRLIQFVLIAQMTDEEKETMRRGVHSLLASGNPRNPSRPANWERYLALRPHVEVSRAVESRDPLVHKLISGMVKFLYYWGDHTGSENLAEEAYGYWVEHPGEDDPQTLRLAKWLGYVRWLNGKFTAARELNQRTLATYQSKFGDSDEGTIDAMNMVAIDLRTSGDFAAARDLDERALELSRRVFGDDYGATLSCAYSLGVSLRLNGEFARAAEVDRDTYERRSRILGADDDATLNTRNGLLIDIRESGMYLEAARQQEELYEQHLKAFGENAPATLRVARTLAVARRKAGHHDIARDLAQETLERYRRRYGDDYPDTIATAVNVAVDLRQAGNLRQARELGERTLDRYRRMFGVRHAYTLSARTNLAIVLRLSGEVEAAFRHNSEALELLEATLGVHHAVTLTCATNLASDLFALGETQKAYERDSATIARSERALGVEHPSTLACSANLALDLQQLGRTGESDRILTDTLARFRQVLGPKHPAVLNARESIRADCDVDPMPL